MPEVLQQKAAQTALARTQAPVIGGPWYEQLSVGECFDSAPALTLTEGQAALHQAILGDRLRLPLDHELSARVLGPGPALAHPALVWDVAIGQSTLATQRVVANLFYRGLRFLRFPRIGDTLHTLTEVVALRDTSRKPGRPDTGLAVLRVRTADQLGRRVLDFHRCAMVAMGAERPGHEADLAAVGEEIGKPVSLLAAVAGWDLAPLSTDPVRAAARTMTLEGGETVSSAPELARATLNVAAVHTDPTATPDHRRLVYGGHTIGVACAHLTRLVPELITVLAWRSCDHLAPVLEGDVLRSSVELEPGARRPGGGQLAEIRVRTSAQREGAEPVEVLDWRLVGLLPGEEET